MACENFWQNRKMRFFGIISNFNFRSPIWQIFTIFQQVLFIGSFIFNLLKFSKPKTVVTGECLRKGSKYICLRNLGRKLGLTKIYLFYSCWTHLPYTMFWQCILNPQNFRFQTVFLFKLKYDCNKNWIFCFPSKLWPLKIKISPNFSYLYTKLCDLEVLKNMFWPKCWYLPLKMSPEAVSDENRTKFFKANFNPLKLTFLRLYLKIMGRKN